MACAAIYRTLNDLYTSLTQGFRGPGFGLRSLVDTFSPRESIPGLSRTPKLYDEATEGFRAAGLAGAGGLPVLGVGTKPSSSLMLGLYCMTECDQEADCTCTGQ